MPPLPTTSRAVDALQPAAKRLEYFDGVVPGLALRITPHGARTWAVLYRHRGRLRRLTLGPAAVLSLASARDRAREALREVTDGKDPAAAKLEARRAETVGDLARDFIAKYAKPRKRSWKEDDRMLRADVLPAWEHRAIRDITRRDVRQLVDAIAERGAPIMANRVLSLVSKLFKWALDEDLIDASPAVRVPRPAAPRQRDRVLSEDEIRALWTALEAQPLEMAAFFQLRLITAQRGGEVATMQWADVDLVQGWWTIPASVSKNGLAHRVPLSPMAITLLQQLRDRAGAAGEVAYVIAGARGRRQRSEAAGELGIADFRGHDLRRTAASLMAGGGIPRLVIAKILNHVEKDVTAVYDRHSYDQEKRAALHWWATRLEAIVSNDRDGSNVLAFAAR